MLSNRRAKIAVDVLMTIFVIMSFVRWDGSGGLIFHAVVGTVFALLAAVHLHLNRKWLVSVTKSMMARATNKKIKRLYAVNMALIVLWSIAIITGFLAIPAFIQGAEADIFGRIHGVSSRIGGVVIFVHIYQHWGQIRSYLGLKGNQRAKSGDNA